VQAKDKRAYDVYGLLAAGRRFTDDYDEDDAVREFVDLHPGADAAQVRADLQAEIAKRGG
jgi:hypothetical protein